MKCRMRRHFIRVYTVCCDEIKFQKKRYNFIWKFNWETSEFVDVKVSVEFVKVSL